MSGAQSAALSDNVAYRPLALAERTPFERKLHFAKKDRIACFALTAVYSICALINLGSNVAPEVEYFSDTPGQEATISFANNTTLSEIWVFGGIAEGNLVIRADGGQEVSYEQVYDDMFRWHPVGMKICLWMIPRFFV